MTRADRGSLFDRPLPPGYREELGALVESEPVRAQVRGESILIFQIGPLRLALPTRIASAVGPVLHIARIPHRSGTVLLGLVAFRGEILPCCSLARLLDVEQNQSTQARTLILEESAARAWAVPIDAVLGIHPIPGETAPIAAPLAGHWIRGSYDDGAGGYHLLDADNLFRQITLATA
jgi:chemotaxis-related protein WspD